MGDARQPSETPVCDGTRQRARRLGLVVGVWCLLAISQPASAHTLAGTNAIGPAYGVGAAVLGLLVVVTGVLGNRSARVTATQSLGIVLGGLVVTLAGIVLLDVLTPDLLYSASSMPFPRSWYPFVGAGIGSAIALASLLLGWVRWPTRPRYTFFGVLLALWILYPGLFLEASGESHPLGYALVLGTPVFVGYILWADAGDMLTVALRDAVARRFGAAVAILTLVFFLMLSGYLSVFPEEGIPHQTNVVVLPVIYQLVMWPTLEISLPHIPFFLALSPGQLTVAGLLSTLVGLNATLIARSWRERADAGALGGTAGSATIIGSCTCGCCGPIIAKVAVLAAGPSIAAPVYWLFVDSASPLSTVFIVASIALFTGSIVRATGGSDRFQPDDTVGATA